MRRRPLPVTEGDVQRVPVRGAKLCELAEQREQHLVQPGIGQVRLELHPVGPQHPGARLGGRFGRRVQQDRLAGAWLAEQQQRFSAGPGPLHKRADQREFIAAPD